MQDNKIEITVRELKEHPSVCVASVTGSIDSYTARSFSQPILSLTEYNVSVVIIDCGGITYVSSAGIGSFVICADRFAEKGGLVLYNLQQNVLKIFTMLNMASFFNISKTRDEALEKALSLHNK